MSLFFLGKYQLTVGHSTEVMLLIDCTAELDAEQLCPEMLTASWNFKIQNVGFFRNKITVANWNFLKTNQGGNGVHIPNIYILRKYLKYSPTKMKHVRQNSNFTPQNAQDTKHKRALKDLPSHGFGESPHTTHSSNCLPSTHFYFLRSAKKRLRFG